MRNTSSLNKIHSEGKQRSRFPVYKVITFNAQAFTRATYTAVSPFPTLAGRTNLLVFSSTEFDADREEAARTELEKGRRAATGCTFI